MTHQVMDMMPLLDKFTNAINNLVNALSVSEGLEW